MIFLLDDMNSGLILVHGVEDDLLNKRFIKYSKNIAYCSLNCLMTKCKCKKNVEFVMFFKFKVFLNMIITIKMPGTLLKSKMRNTTL